MKISGRKELFYQIASTISFLAGGYLATKSYNLAFGFTIIIGMLTIAQAFTFKEPSLGKKEKSEIKGNAFVEQLKDSVAAVKNNTKIGVLIVFVECISAFCTCTFFYLQNYLKGNGYNEGKIGIIYALSALVSAMFSTQVHKLDKKIGERGILLVIPILTIGCIWGVALSKYSFVFFIALMITEGIIFVSSTDYINKIVPSENRATILSFQSMVFSFFMITMFPLVGLIGDRYSLSLAFKCLAVAGTIFLLVNNYVILSNKKNSN